MKNKRQHFELDHWRAQEILHSYAEMERARGNAAKFYPDAARHLLECGVCRDTLEDILTTTEIAIPRRRVSANDLGFLRRLREWRGQSHAQTISPPLIVPLKAGSGLEYLPDVRRSSDSSQESRASRPLYLDMARIGASAYVLLITLYESDQPEHYRLTGELSADESELDQIKVVITTGRNTYTALIMRNRFLFDDLLIQPDLEHLSVTFEQS